jgi:hypothetical protein
MKNIFALPQAVRRTAAFEDRIMVLYAIQAPFPPDLRQND